MHAWFQVIIYDQNQLLLFLYIQPIPKQVLINLFKEINCLLTSGFKDLSAHAETLSSTPSACPLPKSLNIIPLY